MEWLIDILLIAVCLAFCAIATAGIFIHFKVIHDIEMRDLQDSNQDINTSVIDDEN